jgi:type IV pilus assembly protein PilN
MIRINLLPQESKKSRRKIKLPSVSGGAVIWAVVVLVLYAGVVFSVSALQMKKLSSLETQILEAKEESARLAPQLAKIRKLTKEREEVNRRLGIIAALDRDRYLRVQMLDELSVSLPANCWFTDLTEQGGTNVSIEGVTFSNYIIADLMNNIDKSKRFSDTSLKVAEEGDIEQHRVIQFTLNSRLLQ